jgi:AdoMet-dependent heme synthase
MKIKPIELSAPISTELILTQQCNLRCKHCIFNCSPEKRNRLSKEKIFDIIDQLADMKVFTIGLNGGEPLLLKDEIYDIINYIKNKNLNFLLTTNGTLLNDKMIKFLKEKDILCIRISLDSISEEVHNEFRGTDFAYHQAIENIKKCVKEGIETTVLISLTHKNLQEFDDIVAFGKELGVNSLNFFPIMPHGRAKNLKELIISQESYKNFLNLFMQKRKEIKIPVLLGDFPLEHLMDKEDENQENVFGKCCPAGCLSMVISWDGKVFPCPLFPIEAGNIFEQPIKKIWKSSPLLKEIRNVKRFSLKCNNCKHLNICRGGCLARTYLKNSNLSGADPLCWYDENK